MVLAHYVFQARRAQYPRTADLRAYAIGVCVSRSLVNGGFVFGFMRLVAAVFLGTGALLVRIAVVLIGVGLLIALLATPAVLGLLIVVGMIVAAARLVFGGR